MLPSRIPAGPNQWESQDMTPWVIAQAVAEWTQQPSWAPFTRTPAVADAERLGVPATHSMRFPDPTPHEDPLDTAAALLAHAGTHPRGMWGAVRAMLPGIQAIAVCAAGTPMCPRSHAGMGTPAFWWDDPDDMALTLLGVVCAMPPDRRAAVWVVHPMVVDMPHLPQCAWIPLRSAAPETNPPTLRDTDAILAAHAFASTSDGSSTPPPTAPEGARQAGGT